MPETIRLKNLEDKRELRRLILTYFQQPRLSRNMTDHEIFEGVRFTKPQIHTMMRSLDMAGLVHKVRGQSQGSVYQTTDDGDILMIAMDEAIRRAEARDKGNSS